VAAFDLVIFDCDGVLVDSEVIACHATAEALHAIGHAVSAETVSQRFMGISNRDMYAALEIDMGRALPAGFDADMNRRAALRFERELRAMPGLDASLSSLGLATCVASSSTPDVLAAKLRWAKLAHWFGDAVFSTAMVARGKPAPDIFLYAAQRMSVAVERCLVIEDSASGITAAKAAGMTAFGFIGGSHCRAGHAGWLTDAGADLVFSEMRALPALMAQRNATLTTS
jgi:HAD superfamily hydrolase (TIGR01509 family)